MQKQQNKVAIVTGAARGLGAGVAAALAKKGYSVGLVGLEGERLRENAKAIGDKAKAFEVDVTDRTSIGSAFEGVRERFGRIDVVISNAGITNYELLATMSPDNFRRVMAVNVEGTFNAIQASIPHLIESKGYFLAIASLSAAVAPPGLGVYGASKRATESLADTFRFEIAHKGVDVGVAYFGWLATDLVTNAGEHPAFTYMRTHLPGPLKSIAPSDLAINAIVKGVLRRKRRVIAPGYLRLSLGARWLIAGNPAPFKKQMPDIERLFADDKKRNDIYMTDPARR